ncbi:MAG: diguanylate cyclase [Betaproteobacteria bacterium]|nr:diguanylate cyclase [Betaproteobacteria bacterium]
MTINPITRISLGLISMVVGLLMMADLAFNVLRDDLESVRQVRERLSQSIAVQITSMVQRGDRDGLGETLRELVRRSQDIRSLAVRRADGQVLAMAGNHAAEWTLAAGAHSTLSNIAVPMLANGERWGDVELGFASPVPMTVMGWLSRPKVLALVLLVVVGGVGFHLYLRRVLQQLDPSSAIPERVRTAFDVLTEGVLIVDRGGRIMLANAAFRGLHRDAEGKLNGRRITELQWLMAGLGDDAASHPWERSMREKEPVRAETMELPQPSGRPRRAMANCAPVMDAAGEVRGCMITIDDVTDLERTNEHLLEALRALDESRQQIRAQNEELRRLATRDPLTGCLNRRSFFESAKGIFERHMKSSEEIACIMGDIDHFKGVNDTYGHAVGDYVIRAVAQIMGDSLRPEDLLCRYGGEEFCVLLPRTTEEQALKVAERIRTRIQDECGTLIATVPGMKVTNSLGVSWIGFGAEKVEEMLDQADQALYRSKKGGRNRVTSFGVIAGEKGRAQAA